MNYPRIFERVYCQPVCVTMSRFLSIHAFLLPRITGKEPLATIPVGQPRAVAVAMPDGCRPQDCRPDNMGRLYTLVTPSVAVIPVYGALAKNLSAWERDCGGGTDINPISAALAQAVNADDVTAIILDIDSPGGEVTGIPELGAQVRAATAVKPVYAFTDALMASAAYWIGSQASEIYCTPSSQLGSIGTYLAWLDETVRLQMEGVALQFFAEGKHKGIGLPGRPLSQDDRNLLQSRVTAINDKFRAAVTSCRPLVTDDMMQGQTFSGDDSATNGLADGLVSCFDELIELIAGQ